MSHRVFQFRGFVRETGSSTRVRGEPSALPPARWGWSPSFPGAAVPLLELQAVWLWWLWRWWWF